MLDRYSFTMDADTHLVIRNNRAVLFEGSYEAFCADGDIQVPNHITQEIHSRWDAITEPSTPSEP